MPAYYSYNGPVENAYIPEKERWSEKPSSP